MQQPIDDATAQFLVTATGALQREIGGTGVVDGLAVEQSPTGVLITAAIRIGDRTTEAHGAGVNLVTAYTDLRLQAAQIVLASAFTDLVDA